MISGSRIRETRTENTTRGSVQPVRAIASASRREGEGRREGSLRAHELLPIPRSIHRGQKTRFLRETIIVLSTFRIPLDNVSASSLTGLIDDRAPPLGQLLLLLSIESLMPRILIRSTFCFHRLRTSYFDSIYIYIYISISCLLLLVNQGSCS